MIPACAVDHVVRYTAVRYIRTCRILAPASAFLHPLMIPNRTTNEKTGIRFYGISRDMTFPQREVDGRSKAHAESGYTVEHYLIQHYRLPSEIGNVTLKMKC